MQTLKYDSQQLRLLVALLLLVLGCQPAAAWAEAGDLTITSNSLEMDDKRQTVVFKGSVKAMDGEMWLAADKMTVRYNSDTQAQKTGERIRSIRADGNVVIKNSGHHGMASAAVYEINERTLKLLGGKNNAVINKGKDRVEGKTILLRIGQDRRIEKSSVLGEKGGRVSVRISPKGTSGFSGKP
ncbi:MAG: hypothetical protein HQL52_13960 [Magnetococcales bacterium]|nr:hypothetical protein [Magnetococcales bacterium]